MKKLVFIYSLLFSLSSFAQLPSYVPTSGLVAFWPFSGNANDLSGNSQNGTVNGATLTTDRFGIPNKAYSFNSANSNTISVPNSASLRIINSISISGWFLTNATNCPAAILGMGGPSGTSGYNLLATSFCPSNVPSFGRQNIQTSNIFAVNLSQSYNNNVWTFICATYDGTNQRIYINGVLVASGISTFSLPTMTEPLFIGKESNDQPRLFTGKLDDIGIWNRALTQTEITSLFASCGDSISIQPSNKSGFKGQNVNFNFVHSNLNSASKWQTNPIGCGWQDVPNLNQYSGVTTNTLTVSGLTVSNHNQKFRVITNNLGCNNDTSKVVAIILNDIIADSIRLVALKADSIVSRNSIAFLKMDTTSKGIMIRQLKIDLLNKHDTIYIASSITGDTLRIGLHTGISSNSPTINALKVYPNPASTILNIELQNAGYFTARLTGITGQAIISPTSGIIDISGLATGVYILTIYDSLDKLISTNKVMITR